MKKSILASLVALAVSAPSFASVNLAEAEEETRILHAEEASRVASIRNTTFVTNYSVAENSTTTQSSSVAQDPMIAQDTAMTTENEWTSGEKWMVGLGSVAALAILYAIFNDSDDDKNDDPIIEGTPENPIASVPENPIEPMPPQDGEGWDPEGEDDQGIIGSGLIEVEYGEENQRMWVVRDEDGGISMNYVIVEKHDDNTYTITRNNEDSTATVKKGNSTLAITSDSHEGTLSVTKYDGQVYVTAINADGDMKSKVFDGEKWNPIEVTDPELEPENPIIPANPDFDSWSVEKHEIADATQVTFSNDDGRVMNITMQDGSISYVKVDADGNIIDAGKRDPRSIDRSKLNNIKAKVQARFK
ncbi:hypothetical protein AB4343_17280 [Vibrio breoganii]|uniref:hypothetical protein n=1 Tax=Vibrio breoganii TaxID=553239 RepID=UPI000C852012|nr:hypothetical protein [Vibrio breoganii]PMP06620.1 hypothetical protein BCS94_11455 [Vibrio breoganii]TKF87991.1 hypothetical protein FCV82_08475 [Vibrio breoganii]